MELRTYLQDGEVREAAVSKAGGLSAGDVCSRPRPSAQQPAVEMEKVAAAGPRVLSQVQRSEASQAVKGALWNGAQAVAVDLQALQVDQGGERGRLQRRDAVFREVQVSQRGGETPREARELVALQGQDLQLAQTLERSGLDHTDVVVLQIQACQVPEFSEGARGDVSDAVFLELQGLQAGGQAAGDAGQQVATQAQLQQAGEGPELLVHVAEPVSGHRQS